MQYLLILVCLCLFGCNPSGTPTQSAQPSVAPGSSAVSSPYKWTAQPISDDLYKLLQSFQSPDDVAEYMVKNFKWQDDYDTSEFLSAQQVYVSKRAVCSGFTRFWQDALAVQGYSGATLAFWGAESAHMVFIYKDATGHYRLCSNQYHYRQLDLGTTFEAAMVNSAAEFYGSNWRVVNKYNGGGKVEQRLQNEKFVGAPLLSVAPDGQQLFRIQGR